MDRYEKATRDMVDAGVTVHRISTYRELGEYRDDWAAGRLGALPLYICSRPQLGKSKHFADVGDALHLKIHASAWGIYHTLWHHQNEQVILDDLDALLHDVSANALLKALMEDSPARRLTWTTDNSKISKGEIPSSYEFTGRVAVLSNGWPRDPAVLSRAFSLRFTPSVAEAHAYARTWLPQEALPIWEYVGDRLDYVPAPDLNRWYLQPSTLASIGRDWRTYLDALLDAPDIRYLVELEGQPLARDERAALWAKWTGGSARTYYRRLAAYRHSHPLKAAEIERPNAGGCQIGSAAASTAYHRHDNLPVAGNGDLPKSGIRMAPMVKGILDRFIGSRFLF